MFMWTVQNKTNCFYQHLKLVIGDKSCVLNIADKQQTVSTATDTTSYSLKYQHFDLISAPCCSLSSLSLPMMLHFTSNHHIYTTALTWYISEQTLQSVRWGGAGNGDTQQQQCVCVWCFFCFWLLLLLLYCFYLLLAANQIALRG